MMKRRLLFRRHESHHEWESDGRQDQHVEEVHVWRPWSKRRRLKTILPLTVCVLFNPLTYISIATVKVAWLHQTRVKPVRSTYTPPSHTSNGTNNELLIAFERVMSEPDLRFLPAVINYVPLIIEGGRVLCRGSHHETIASSRTRAYVEMLNRGAADGKLDPLTADGRSLPVMLIDGDHSGCLNSQKVDEVNFPRLTWHTPALKFGAGWCQAISMVGYEMWNPFRSKHARRDSWFADHTWDSTFRKDEGHYPWSKKIDKAVWRGATTGSWREYGRGFDGLPRARLVRKGMERPDIIDAGFTSFVQDYAGSGEELVESNKTKAAEKIRFIDQMKFVAIIDVDGNTWSSRFAMLLCTNSVIIKIDPDFIEYFYDDLQPMVHYVPASLENITEVVEYVINERNKSEMKSIVQRANSWCKGTNNKEQLPIDAALQLNKYNRAVNAFTPHWDEEWQSVRQRIQSNVGDDLVECRF